MKISLLTGILTSLILMIAATRHTVLGKSIEWQPVGTHIMSKWANDVNPGGVLPKYPYWWTM